MIVAKPKQKQCEQRFLLRNVSWRTYRTFLAELADRPVRLTYDRGNLELMAPSYNHEWWGRRFGRFIDTLAEELNIPIQGAGSTTFSREDLERGLEPDECYYIQHQHQVLGPRELDLNQNPPPDLAIEIDITRSSLDRMIIYAALGVRELWRFDGESLQVFRLGPQATYEPTSRSVNFPFLPLPELVQLLAQTQDLDETALVRSFRAWIKERIIPARNKGGDGIDPQNS